MNEGAHDRRAASPEPANTAVGSLRVLVANEPRSYRETISTVMTQLRPHFEIFTAEPMDLDRQIPLLLPDLVVCSHLTRTVESEVPAWVELYPDGASQTIVSVDGERSVHRAMDFDTLLSVLDHVGSLRKQPRTKSP